MKETEIKVLKVEPGKEPEMCILKNELDSLQEAVGGLIEFLSLDDENRIDLTCNEEGKLLYRVQVGAYSVKANADAQLVKVKAKGFDTYWCRLAVCIKFRLVHTVSKRMLTICLPN